VTEKFLANYLGGRYQESFAPEVSKRLQEITVDPKTVKLPAHPSEKQRLIGRVIIKPV
jgi:hypothetical protein